MDTVFTEEENQFLLSLIQKRKIIIECKEIKKKIEKMKRVSTLKKNLTLTLELHAAFQSSCGRDTVFISYSFIFYGFD